MQNRENSSQKQEMTQTMVKPFATGRDPSLVKQTSEKLPPLDPPMTLTLTQQMIFCTFRSQSRVKRTLHRNQTTSGEFRQRLAVSFCHFAAPWVSLKLEIFRPVPIRCRCVFTLLPSQVLSVLLMVNYLTMNHTAQQGGGANSVI